MATRGRKPTPTALKILEGNPGGRAINIHEPKPEKKKLRCPTYIKGEARKEWNRLAGTLVDMGVLTEVDITAFAGYCQSYANWREAEDFIAKHGVMIKTPNGYLQQIPQVSIAQTNLKLMLKFAEQFGLTPSARSRIVAGEGSADSVDEMERLLSFG